MAIFHFHTKVFTRTKMHSAVAKAAYRSGEKMKDEFWDKTRDYRRKTGIENNGIISPRNSPSWVNKREKLWNNVEKNEKRKDSQLAREFELGLPHEITADEREKLVKDFIIKNLTPEGMVCDYAIHSPNTNKGSDGRAFHAHVMTTMRDMNEDGFGAKNREWNDKIFHNCLREMWGEEVNKVLSEKGLDLVDFRTLKEQGVEDREPQSKDGPTRTYLKRRGVETKDMKDIKSEIIKRKAKIINLGYQEHFWKFDVKMTGKLYKLFETSSTDKIAKQVETISKKMGLSLEDKKEFFKEVRKVVPELRKAYLEKTKEQEKPREKSREKTKKQTRTREKQNDQDLGY